MRNLPGVAAPRFWRLGPAIRFGGVLMSVRTMAKVWEFSQHKGNDLLMLLAIADFADDDGKAYPSVNTLAEKCRMQGRGANKVLAALRASGELEIRQNEGPKGTNLYRIVLAPHALSNRTPPVQTDTLSEKTAPPVQMDPIPLSKWTDEPSVNHQEPPEVAQALSPAARKSKKGEITLAQFLEHCKSSGEKSIPADDPIWEYAQKVGITDEMIAVAWVEFKSYWLPTKSHKKDWRGTFRNAVRQNRAGLWYLKEDEPARWTTAGEQARRAAA